MGVLRILICKEILNELDFISILKLLLEELKVQSTFNKSVPVRVIHARDLFQTFVTTHDLLQLSHGC